MADQLTEDLTSLKIDRDSGPRRGGSLVRIVVVLVLLAAVAAGGVAAWPYLEARLFKTEVQTTEVLSISPAQAATLLTSTGYVVPQRHTKVAAKLERRLARVLVHQGDVVTVGLGFSRLSILVSFLFESFMLSLLGGVIGALACGWDDTPGIVSVWAERDGRAFVWRRDPAKGLGHQRILRDPMVLADAVRFLVQGRTA